MSDTGNKPTVRDYDFWMLGFGGFSILISCLICVLIYEVVR